MDIKKILDKQQDFFYSNKTKDVEFRKEQLQKLKDILQKNEDKLYTAIYKDFGKSKFDTYTTELSLMYNDIDYYLKNLSYLARPKKVSTNLVNQIAFSSVNPEPLGSVLVIGAWNYPYQLSLVPAIAAIAAGNTVILKPSEVAKNTMHLMQQLINDNFEPSLFYCAVGGVEETTEILKLKFDKIFFTGSSRVGKIIYEAAAKNLTPVTLELGGKSPAIVTQHANLKVAAKRIVWGKFLNAGQTCVAPDYILAEDSIKDSLVNHIIAYLKEYDYKPDSEHFTKIINEKNFDRLIDYIDQYKVIFGGKFNKDILYIEPTLMDDVSWEDKVMQEEIFGPILPILTFVSLDKAFKEIKARPKPLSAYLFSNNAKEKEKFKHDISFGGGCINDTIMHLSNDALPFGGVGNSGIGHYHGRYGFETFSHMKSIMNKATWGEPDLKYPPYTEKKLSWIKKAMKGLF